MNRSSSADERSLVARYPSQRLLDGDATERLERLRRQLRANGFLWAGPGQPITGRDGTSAPWMLYTPQVTLSHEGMRLAVSCLLDPLAAFRSTQLAAFGYTAMPLLSGCIALSGGRYSGLMIREARKSFGANRQVEGSIDRSQAVIVIDDSLSSGRSFLGAARALEAEGLEVEGTVSVVHFPCRGGAERARGLGYRVETLLDVWDDLGMERPSYTAAHERIQPTWATVALPEGLHPADAARATADHYLKTGTALLPPARFDKEYAADGGIYVSFRDPATDERIARNGFWHFRAGAADPPRDLVLATIRTVDGARGQLTALRLPFLKIAVSLLGPLRRAGPKELDFERYGIVVRSRHWPTKVGGALPNTQVFTSEIEQFNHARKVNAQASDFEPYELFVHELTKCVQPGQSWLPYGVPDDDLAAWRVTAGERLTGRAGEALDALLAGRPLVGEELPEDLISSPVSAVAVTLYDHGVVGCAVAWLKTTLDDAILAATRAAARDRRFVNDPLTRAGTRLAIVVSVLHDREWLGDATVQQVGRKMRHGLDALSVHQGRRAAIFLESVSSHYNWSEEQTARRLLEKAGIMEGGKTWFTYRTTSWLRNERALPLQYGLPRREHAPVIDDDWVTRTLSLTAGYLHDSLDSSCLPVYRSYPISGVEVRKGTAARLCHALGALWVSADVLLESGWRQAAAGGLRYCLDHLTDDDGGRLRLPGQQSSRMGDLALVDAIGRSHDPALRTEAWIRLAASLRVLFQEDGRVADEAAGRVRQVQDHDFMPGVAVLAFAQGLEVTNHDVFRLDWDRLLAWYRNRYQALHPWGLIAWHLQAWTAVYRLTGLGEHMEFVFQMADWVVERQLDKNGAFLTSLYQHGPSFHTAFVAEGVADAWWLAAQAGDRRRADHYEASWRAAMAFMERLVILPEDTYCMSRGSGAVGGTRGTENTTEVRVDYVSHLVMALVKGRAAGAA